MEMTPRVPAVRWEPAAGASSRLCTLLLWSVWTIASDLYSADPESAAPPPLLLIWKHRNVHNPAQTPSGQKNSEAQVWAADDDDDDDDDSTYFSINKATWGASDVSAATCWLLKEGRIHRYE